jgi:predicted aconitase
MRRTGEVVTEIHHTIGDNQALVVLDDSAVLITTHYPIADRNEVKRLLQCYQHKQNVPETRFSVYNACEVCLAVETFDVLRKMC